MKYKLFLVGLFSLLGAASAEAASNKVCRNMGNSVCAQDTRTGQCTHSWDNRDGVDAMRACKVYTGEISTKVDRRNYQCTGNRDRACARSLRTGQCTHEWSSRDGGGDALYSCRVWMGEINNRVDRRNYVCAGDRDRVCARSIRTGQCTHVWTRRDGVDPWFSCRQWMRQ